MSVKREYCPITFLNLCWTPSAHQITNLLFFIQLNKYQTDLYLRYVSHDLTWNYLLISENLPTFDCLTFLTLHSDPDSKKVPKNQILSENISKASIYSSQVIEVHFCVKNSYFFHFHQISTFFGHFTLWITRKSNIKQPIVSNPGQPA